MSEWIVKIVVLSLQIIWNIQHNVVTGIHVMGALLDEKWTAIADVDMRIGHKYVDRFEEMMWCLLLLVGLWTATAIEILPKTDVYLILLTRILGDIF